MDAKVAESLERLYAAWAEAEARDSATWPAALRCPAGCSRCCERSPDVPVTPAEAVRVAEAIGRLPAERRDAIRRRIAETARWLTDSARAAGTRAPVPCPLLEGHLCAIYADRPLVCRAYGFAAERTDRGGAVREIAYLGCEILEPVVRGDPSIRLPNHAAACAALPRVLALDRDGKALPDVGPLAEMLDRLLA